jgi:translation initiation factor IF-2
MSENKEQEPKKVLSLSGRPKLELKGRGPDTTSQVRQSFSHGRSKAVTVEVKPKRTILKPNIPAAPPEPSQPEPELTARRPDAAPPRPGPQVRQLTAEEREARVRALRSAAQGDDRRAPEAEHLAFETQPEAAAPAPVAETRVSLDPETRRQRELEELRRIQEQEKKVADEAERIRQEAEGKKKTESEAEKKKDEERKRIADRAGESAAAKVAALNAGKTTEEEEEEERRARAKRGIRAVPAKAPPPPRTRDSSRRNGKLTISQALTNEGESMRMRSLAAVRRAREKERQRQSGDDEQAKVVRDVILPETITVQELAQRMAERSGDVVKALMRMGVMATITQTIDADTA